MPSTKQEKNNGRLAFLADRMALLMVELVRRDFEYGRFCHEEFFTDEVAGYLQQGKEYQVCKDFVRMMIRRHDEAVKLNELERKNDGPKEPPRETDA